MDHDQGNRPIEAAPAGGKTGRNQSCPCGSGKKFKNCCGAFKSAPAAPSVKALLGEGFRAQQAGQLVVAAARYRDALALNPHHPHANYLLGVLETLCFDFEHAAELMAAALSYGLSDAAAHFNYGNVLCKLDRLDEAGEQYQRAVELKPDFTEAHNHLGNVHFESRRFGDAETAYRGAIKIQPENWDAWYNLSMALSRQGRDAEALECFDRATSIDPGNPEAHAGRAILCERTNLLDQATDSATEALNLQTDHPGALTVLARIARRNGEPDRAFELLSAIELEGLSLYDRISVFGERGQILEERGDHGAAFEAFATAKRHAREYFSVEFDRDAATRRFAEVESYFFEKKLTELSGLIDTSSSAQAIPVFVLGFHRSGTTLVEQILSSHDAIQGGGELENIREIEENLERRFDIPYPACMDAVLASGDTKILTELRDSYLADIVDMTGNESTTRWVVDKHPFNSLRLPLIRLLFPEAPIIRVVRHPLDIVLSSYFTSFSEANEWSFDLGDTAWYHVGVCEHIERMKTALEIPLIELRYEDLVGNFETSARDLLSRIGAPWDPKCLEFHLNPRVSRTASYAQVSQPLYSSSVNRYRDYLAYVDESILAQITPILDAGGYEVTDG
jgi:tetratricopeptide (TPR) repeat protein